MLPIITMSTPSTAMISSIAASEAADSNCTITVRRRVQRRQRLRRGHAAVAELRQAAGEAAAAERRVLGGRHHRARFGRGTHARRDHAQRAAVEHARNVFGSIRRHAHEGRHAGLERHDAELAGGLHREARVLEVDVEAVEARALGDAHDLDRRHEAHGDRGDAPRRAAAFLTLLLAIRATATSQPLEATLSVLRPILAARCGMARCLQLCAVGPVGHLSNRRPLHVCASFCGAALSPA